MYNTTFFPSTGECNRLLRSAHDEGPCTSTEQSAGSSGLYSTATDMEIWLKYLLGTGTPAQDPAAQAVYIQPSHLVRQQGLDHAGEPTGVGLGWLHLLPADSPSHIVEKTGGGAGFLTYIAINHAHHAAVFLAATDGPDKPKTVAHGAGEPAVQTPHLNSFYAANNLLLAVTGLPPLPPPPPRPVATVTHKRGRAHRQKKQ